MASIEGLPFNSEEFFADVVDAVHELRSDGFSKFEQSVLRLVDESDHEKLHEAVEAVELKVQTALGECFEKWQRYCEEHCFQVPQEPASTALKDVEQRGSDTNPADALKVDELDAELVKLRSQIVNVRKEKMKLRRECTTLEALLNAKRAKVNVVAHAATELNRNFSLIQAEIGQASAKLQEKMRDVGEMSSKVSLRDSLIEDAGCSKPAIV